MDFTLKSRNKKGCTIMNMTIQFDTLRFVEKLKAAGMPEAQAKAGAEALAGALGEAASSTSSDLATKGDITGIKGDITGVKGDITGIKGDITDIKVEMADMKAELKIVRWIGTIIVAGTIALIMKAFF